MKQQVRQWRSSSPCSRLQEEKAPEGKGDMELSPMFWGAL